jgi:hypothetical protein
MFVVVVTSACPPPPTSTTSDRRVVNRSGDAVQTDKTIEVVADIPGVTKDDIHRALLLTHR